eukprot:TRINITY_DN6656_c0_g1_i1.p1 TRINITY_DN6656_c0_g1~~TRINITY_DN6656_c0_g1_i1.p1  ORF type:complete len:338 (-),score=113.52 TRINITY_DN6656_c0_g1_i1:76-1089(-)
MNGTFFFVLLSLVAVIAAAPCPAIQTPGGRIIVDAITAPPGAQPLSKPFAVPVNSTDFANAIAAGSVGACPVNIIDNGIFTYSIAKVHYYLLLPNATTVRDSWAYQYLDGVNKYLRYDEIFVVDQEFDALHPESVELYETLSYMNGTLYNIAIGPQNPPVTCIVAPGFPVGFMNPAFANFSTYVGVHTFPAGVWQTGTTFDVWVAHGIWLQPTSDIYYYVDRQTGFLAGQVYHQAPPGFPYLWDTSFAFSLGNDAKPKLPASLFEVPWLKSLCPKPATNAPTPAPTPAPTACPTAAPCPACPTAAPCPTPAPGPGPAPGPASGSTININFANLLGLK